MAAAGSRSHSVVRHLNGPYLQRVGVNTQVQIDI
jgi:hypothetical protein